MPEKKISKAAALRALHEELGRCVALTEKETECRNWAIDRVNDRGYCGQHVASILLREDSARREATRKAEVDHRIETFMAWSALHPSTWDRMPAGWQPEAAN